MALPFEWHEARSSYNDPEKNDPEKREISTVFHTAQLPFYQRIELVRMPKPVGLEGPDDLFDYYLGYNDERQLVRLDGSSSVIHDANEYENVRLTPETASVYLPFFCYFIHSDQGNFYVLDGKNDPRMEQLRPMMDPDVIKKIAPPTLIREDEAGYYLFSAYTLYGTILAKTEYLVYPQGFVEMGDDDPVWQMPASGV
ncbi:hypothetical protein [Alkalispirochaeta alkalica]|uniref:hypothetical protein n=1 Tax=Alkalispirochaeta alkalica TaxID=46356 RepID=UPI0012FDC026|nr:hypothetical protein [Alkalispirochaeta alkalica]